MLGEPFEGVEDFSISICESELSSSILILVNYVPLSL